MMFAVLSFCVLFVLRLLLGLRALPFGSLLFS